MHIPPVSYCLIDQKYSAEKDNGVDIHPNAVIAPEKLVGNPPQKEKRKRATGTGENISPGTGFVAHCGFQETLATQRIRRTNPPSSPVQYLSSQYHISLSMKTAMRSFFLMRKNRLEHGTV